MACLPRFLEARLRLRVNRAKSAVARPWERTFLGYTFTRHAEAWLTIATGSVHRLKSKLRALWRRGRGRSLRRVIAELTPILRGWTGYFRLSDVKGIFEALDGWVRRRLRAIL